MTVWCLLVSLWSVVEGAGRYFFPWSIFYRGLDVLPMSYDETVTSGIVRWASNVLYAPGFDKALEGLSWVLWDIVRHYFVWTTE